MKGGVLMTHRFGISMSIVFSPLKTNNSTQLRTRELFKTDKVALNNFVDCNDETEWLYRKLYIGTNMTNKLKIATWNLRLRLDSILHYWQKKIITTMNSFLSKLTHWDLHKWFSKFFFLFFLFCLKCEQPIVDHLFLTI